MWILIQNPDGVDVKRCGGDAQYTTSQSRQCARALVSCTKGRGSR